MESSCELGNEPSSSINCWETTEWLHNLWPLVVLSSTELVSYPPHGRPTMDTR
jgi:hypothetical protein